MSAPHPQSPKKHSIRPLPTKRQPGNQDTTKALASSLSGKVCVKQLYFKNAAGGIRHYQTPVEESQPNLVLSNLAQTDSAHSTCIAGFTTNLTWASSMSPVTHPYNNPLIHGHTLWGMISHQFWYLLIQCQQGITSSVFSPSQDPTRVPPHW